MSAARKEVSASTGTNTMTVGLLERWAVNSSTHLSTDYLLAVLPRASLAELGNNGEKGACGLYRAPRLLVTHVGSQLHKGQPV